MLSCSAWSGEGWCILIAHHEWRNAMPDYTDLLYEVADNVATITLNRPDRLNAISGPMLDGLSRALRDADHDPAVRVIIITGAGRGFCAGLDLKDQMSGT